MPEKIPVNTLFSTTGPTYSAACLGERDISSGNTIIPSREGLGPMIEATLWTVGIVEFVKGVGAVVALLMANPEVALFFVSPPGVVLLAGTTVVALMLVNLYWQCARTGSLPIFGPIFGDRGKPIPDICVAGIIDNVFEEAGSDQWDDFFEEHPHFELVLKCIYWQRMSENATVIYTNESKRTQYVEAQSPVTLCYIYSEGVCSRAQAALVGAVPGAIVGGVLGMAANAAVLAGFFCALLGPFCLLVGLLVAAVLTVVGAVLGAAVGRAFATINSQREPPTIKGQTGNWTLRQGNIVKVVGDVLLDNNGAKIFFFVDLNKSWTFGNIEKEPGANHDWPYSHEIPDNYLSFLYEWSDNPGIIQVDHCENCPQSGTTPL